jgi:excisionase family DNA binding protein
MNQKLAYTIEEAATAAGIGRTLIFEEIRNHRLVARKIGRRTVILLKDLDAWLETRPLVQTGAIAADGGRQQ